MSANDRQVGGSHYNSKIQHWDMAYCEFGKGYFAGQVTKYVTRWRKKNGIQDLQKAEHFLQKLIELEQSERRLSAWRRAIMHLAGLVDNRRTGRTVTCDEFLKASEIKWPDAAIISLVVMGTPESLRSARNMLHDIQATHDVGAGAHPTSAYVNQG